MAAEWKHLAKGLTGNPPRLLVAAFFARVGDDWVRQEDVRRETELLQGQVHRALAELAELGLLIVRRQGALAWPYYQRIPSGIWPAMAQLNEAIDELIAIRQALPASGSSEPG
jgi:hypothetical protein